LKAYIFQNILTEEKIVIVAHSATEAREKLMAFEECGITFAYDKYVAIGVATADHPLILRRD
jgi:hypothetical protein